jgi:hypothetical protein
VTDLTEYAREGYDAQDGAEPAYTHGSNAYMAWRIGKWLKGRGEARPSEVTPEHGYSLRVDGVKIAITSAGYGDPCITEN